MNWLSDNCYSSEGEKKVPWKVSELNDSILMSMLRGLIATDGNISEDKRHVGFTNTSKNLAQFVYLSLQRIGCCPSFSVSAPRLGNIKVSDGHIISGNKDVFEITTSGYHSLSFINWYNKPYKMIKKQYNFGYCVSKISEIVESVYTGTVYDVSVDNESHSFSLPGATVHNCGAGMTNTALVYRTIVGMNFSVSKCGDWLDSSAATAVGKTATQIMTIKEKGINLLNPEDGDPKYIREREALIVYYRNLIHYVIDSIKKEFKKSNGSIELPDSIPWIISGGTAKAKNFLEFFKQEFDKVKDGFPINISEIRMANDPLNDVAKGLLIAAMNQ
jgi:hypothetical protein